MGYRRKRKREKGMRRKKSLMYVREQIEQKAKIIKMREERKLLRNQKGTRSEKEMIKTRSY